MPHADFRGMVTHPVMALGKQRDGIYVPSFEGFLELAGVEVGANAGNVFGGVKIEMDLAKAKDVRTHESWKASGLAGLPALPTLDARLFVSL